MKIINSNKLKEKRLLYLISQQINEAFREFIWNEIEGDDDKVFDDPVLPKMESK